MVKRVTMADVAREAGVSLMTVSRTVNNKDGISEATRQRIQDIVERLGYRPSVIARSLVTDRTGTIGLVVIDNSNPFFSEVARGVEHAAYAEGYSVFLCNTEEDAQREIDVLRSLEEKRVDGVILCSSRLNDAELETALEAHSAVVLVNRRLNTNTFGSVLMDDAQGARMITQYMLDQGHRIIGLLAGPLRSFSGQLRMMGYRAALAAAGIPPRPELEQTCLPIVESGREAACDLLDAYPEITALVCYNDLVAIGALQACADRDHRVPGDVAITGFDDIPLAALVTPPLTTCRIPMYDLGSQAMHLLLAHIDGCSDGCDDVVIEPELIIRASA
ncbi:MAG: LacI family DNA-binding transcriptional regulator [Anaerolineae bacterium]|nr:LacI family DNA-binding transcriptional regulator [Anaerolineae bacterium]